MSSIGTMSGGSRTILQLAVDHLGQLRERPRAVLRPCLRDVALERLALLRGPPLGGHHGDVVEIDPRVPDVEVRHARVLVHRRAVRARHGPVDPVALVVAEAAIATGHREARDEPLHVPLERTGQRLVEVVDAEDEPSIGSGEGTEVREVGVAAELDLQTRPRLARQVGRHEVGGTAVERERGHEHPPVADRDQLGHPRRVLLAEQLDRIAPAGGRPPVAVCGSRRDVARGLALRRALGDARVVDRLGRTAPGPWPRCRGGVLDVRHGDITPLAAPRANHPFRAMSPFRRGVMVALR